eukprot:scaffold7258_cov122-Isochrysis_galbana.AAC.10
MMRASAMLLLVSRAQAAPQSPAPSCHALRLYSALRGHGSLYDLRATLDYASAQPHTVSDSVIHGPVQEHASATDHRKHTHTHTVPTESVAVA